MGRIGDGYDCSVISDEDMKALLEYFESDEYKEKMKECNKGLREFKEMVRKGIIIVDNPEEYGIDPKTIEKKGVT